MRTTRVKPPGISTPAYAGRRIFLQIGGWIAAAFVALMVLVPLYQWSTGPSVPPSPPSAGSPWLPGRGLPTPQARAPSHCWGVGNPDPRPLVLAHGAILINPDEGCRVIHEVQYGVVDFVGYKGSFKVGVEGSWTEANAHSVRAESDAARMLYQLCPLSLQGRLLWGCKPASLLGRVLP